MKTFIDAARDVPPARPVIDPDCFAAPAPGLAPVPSTDTLLPR
ncbi:hypothetical protein ACIP98_24400 [Streptomyces sp. NPDC088354]